LGSKNSLSASDIIDATAAHSLPQPLDLVEVSGRIKWFDVSKGYGFIIPDNGLPDVLLHVTILRKDGFQTAHEGARIVCEAAMRA
jgi:CspA family cold shock protein